MIQATTNNMPQDFNSLMEVMEYFTDEKKCLDYLMAQRFDGAIVCPHCASTKIYCFSDGMRYKCGSCRQQFTAKVGTIFEGSKIPMKKWFVAIYLVTSHKKGISSHQLAKDIKVTQKTGWFMLHRIRFALGQGSFEVNMGGNDGGIVEVDEVFIGGLEKNKHASKKSSKLYGNKHAAKTMIVGLLERGGEVRTRVTPIVDHGTLQGIIHLNVKPGSKIVTDAHKGYVGLRDTFDHISIKHTEGKYVTKGEIHTNSIEGYWSLFQRSIIGIYHSVSPKHLQAYCDESAYRYNTRKSNEGNRVQNTISKTNGKRLTYNALISK